jgi:putative holliday junction resolvase
MSILPSAFDLPAGRLLALDLGQARIGVAVCDAAGILASPLIVLGRRPTRAADFAAVAELVRREGAVGVLVGMPAADASVPGSEGEGAPGQTSAQARWTRRYAGRLAASLDVPVAFWDETLSSVDAAERLRESGGRTGIDAAAAALILGDYLEARRRKNLENERACDASGA